MKAGSPVPQKLEEVFGSARVSTQPFDLEATARDCWPRGLIAGPPGERERPLAIVWPERAEDVERLVELARAEGFALAPLGAGSGVCGGFWPDARTVVVDLKRLRELSISPDGAEVHVGAGLLGWELEERLGQMGKTAGHFPSSILCSTVGGWVAARGAGQCSGRYGKIEDLVTELECVLGSGRRLVTRARPQGLQLVPWLVGSEGSLGIVTRVGLRLFPAPAERALAAFAFPTFELGQEALRAIYQSGLRPAVARLYDAVDTLLHTSGKSDEAAEPKVGWGFQTRDALEVLALRTVLRAPGQLARAASALEKRGRARSRLLLLFENLSDPAEEARLASALCTERGGEFLGEDPVRHWLAHRYDVSFQQSKVFRAGAFSDTMEVAAPWSKLNGVYQAVKAAIADRVLLMAHVSHCYPDGAAIYFTFVGRERSRARALARYDAVWDDALTAAVEAGACVSHHHGVGRSKAAHLARQSGTTLRRALSKAWDPEGILNPGVLGFVRDPVLDRDTFERQQADLERRLTERPPFVLDGPSQLLDVATYLSLDEVENLSFKHGLTLDVAAPGELTVGDWVARGFPGAPSPWDDPVSRPVAGFVARLASGELCEQIAAPRRAEGPDLAASFWGTGDALGSLQRVTLVAARRGVHVDPIPGVRPIEMPPSPDELGAFDEVVRALRS